MKKLKSIFSDFKLGIALCSMLYALCSFNAVAATDSSCDDEKNEFINQRLALCSIHAYNIGQTSNPTDAGGKQVMQDVIGLKTTIMAQQMKKQYDFLDTTVRRFKTQLQKAILTAQAQAAGAAATESSGGGGKSANKNVKLNGARDCNEVYSSGDMISCLNNNLSTIRSASDKTNARKQLEHDAKLLQAMATSLKLTESSFKACEGMTNSNMSDCINSYQVQLRLANDNLKSSASGKSKE